jgi:hypothetical protein
MPSRYETSNDALLFRALPTCEQCEALVRHANELRARAIARTVVRSVRRLFRFFQSVH